VGLTFGQRYTPQNMRTSAHGKIEKANTFKVGKITLNCKLKFV
jgi:hypothetical protein